MDMKKLFELAGVDVTKGKAKKLVEQHPEGPGWTPPEDYDTMFAIGDIVRVETESGNYPDTPEDARHIKGLYGQITNVSGKGMNATYTVKWNKPDPRTGSYETEEDDRGIELVPEEDRVEGMLKPARRRYPSGEYIVNQLKKANDEIKSILNSVGVGSYDAAVASLTKSKYKLAPGQLRDALTQIYMIAKSLDEQSQRIASNENLAELETTTVHKLSPLASVLGERPGSLHISDIMARVVESGRRS